MVGTVVFVTEARARGISLYTIGVLQLGFSLLAFLGAGLWAAFELGNPSSLSSLMDSGMRAPGGVLGLAVGLIFWVPLWCGFAAIGHVADCLAFTLVWALAAVRLQCVAVGCCHGVVCELPWAISYPPESPAAHLHWSRGMVGMFDWSMPVHPLPLYLMVLPLVVGGLLYRFRARAQYPGQLFLVFIALHEIGKFLLENFREPQQLAPRSIVPEAALVLSLACTAILSFAGIYRWTVGPDKRPIRAV